MVSDFITCSLSCYRLSLSEIRLSIDKNSPENYSWGTSNLIRILHVVHASYQHAQKPPPPVK